MRVQKKNSLVYVRFPRTGLGNMLLVWARALVFAELNQLPLVTSSWWGIRWGAWLRNEKKKRLYRGCFRESAPVQRLAVGWMTLRRLRTAEPPLQNLPDNRQARLFAFEKVIVQDDLFATLRDHRDLIRHRLEQRLLPPMQERLAGCPAPEIGIHIRRGDFKKGNPITPNSFFIDGIRYVRAKTKKNLAVTVFTDAGAEEIADVLALENVALAQDQPDILDLMQLSKSRIMILSRSSTFSYWAAFLSEAIIIKPVGDWQNQIRSEAVNSHSFEGNVCFNQPGTLDLLGQKLEGKKW